ncbi:hypothetical protein J2W34_001935 [Variovorax boronicumulans]|uniref:toll/interleukin-1 receptor domain-containing protein n=1 Tax=Variovorax boronicumulans TaxID=436515 RepID=UPI002787DAB6|nr:toll/interleukin-1 receptor domain-containing protein [Variovorax boronicumulans]MDQ0070150.1 hypothetical protein [Variovorax boronicumulans]
MANEQENLGEPLPKTGNPLVFISHDTRDAELAEAFSNLLKSVSAGVLKSFRTSDRKGNQGIEYGIEWYPEIIKNIQGASDVVCLLTQRSVNRPWILFEAGMAKGKLDTPILGVALGIELKDASTGPFAQFQNCGDDEESLTKLVFQLVNRIPNSEPDRDTIKFQVGKFKASIEGILEAIAARGAAALASPPKKNVNQAENSSAKLFEEIKIMFQDLPSRIGRVESSGPSKRRRRLYPGMIEEILHSSTNPAVGVRIALSILRNSLPWIYDEGNAVLTRLLATKTFESRRKIFLEFEEFSMVATNSRYLEKYFVESQEEYFNISESMHMVLKSMSALVKP